MGFICVLLLVFILSPIAGVLLGFFSLSYYDKEKIKVISVFFFMAIFLGLLNSLKVSESDLVGYIENYKSVPYYSFFDYLLLKKKEPVFSIFTFCSYYVFAGSSQLYVAFCSTISYFLIFYSIWRLHLSMNLGKYNFMIAIAVAFLFPNLFALSAHLVRQYLAGSIFLYVVIEYVFYNKNKIIPFLIAVFIHTTAVFIGIIFLPILRKQISVKNIFIFVVFAVLFTLLIFKISPLFSALFADTYFIGYAFDRLANRENAWETHQLGVLVFILYSFILIVFYIISKRYKLINHLFLQKLFYINLLLFLFVLINYNDTEIALRFSFYLYFFVPIAFYFLLPIFTINKETTKVFATLIPSIFLCWFVYKLEYGQWTYLRIEYLINFLWITKI